MRHLAICALLGALAVASAPQAGAAQTAEWRVFLSPRDPAFARYPARIYRGPVHRPRAAEAGAIGRRYRAAIAEGAGEGVNFAGDHALVEIGCGTGCATAFVVGLRDGRVALLPPRAYADDLDLMHRPASRYLKLLYRRVRGREERCVGQAYLWTGRRLAPVGPELSKPVAGLVCEGFDRASE